MEVQVNAIILFAIVTVITILLYPPVTLTLAVSVLIGLIHPALGVVFFLVVLAILITKGIKEANNGIQK